MTAYPSKALLLPDDCLTTAYHLMTTMYMMHMIKFMFSKKATKIDEIFTVDLIPCSKRQIDGEDFVNFCGLLRKYELTRVCHGKMSFFEPLL